MDDLSNVFEECEKYLRAALSRWRKQLPELYEDAFQEGMIQCWRDVEAGETVKLKILRRASMSANKFMHRNGEYYFGKPKKSRDGLRTNQKTIDKVKIYLQETKGLRNGVWPTPKQVVDALGINHSSAQKILKDIKEGRIDHMVYREDGRMNWDYYKEISVEVLGNTSEEGSQVREWTDDVRWAETFEDVAISNMDMHNLLMKLSEKHRKVIYLYFYEGQSVLDIGRHFGFTTNISTKGDRQVKNAINQISLLVDPYQGECTAGHIRTAENTYVKQRSDGVWYRVCSWCRTNTGAATAAKQKAEGFRTGRKEKKICPRGHVKDRRDSRGALRCSECRKKAQKKYYAKNKDMYSEYAKDYYRNHKKK